MRNVKFDCIVACDYTPTLKMQQQEIVLRQNGTKWTGSITVAVDQVVLIYCYVAGTHVGSWSLDITTNCPKGTPDKIFSDGDPMPHGGSYAFYTSAKVADPICGAAAVDAVVPEAAVSDVAVPKEKKPKKVKIEERG
jgi:hypothetical protein